MKITPLSAVAVVAPAICFLFGLMCFESFQQKKTITLPDGIYIGTNGIVSSIDHGKATQVTSQATNVTVITRSGVVATTEIRLP